MSDGTSPRDGVPSSRAALSADQKDAIRSELDRVLESVPFRSTKRSQAVLRFIVECALEDRLDLLKERSIGVEVFGRDPDYDTNSDAVVRICANDLRKRLAQYEITASPDNKVLIVLPVGSYIPEFRWLPPSPAGGNAPSAPQIEPKEAVTHRHGYRRPVVWVVSGLCVLTLLGLGIRWSLPKSTLEQFWTPVLRSRAPASIIVGQSVVYLMSRRAHGLYCGKNRPEVESGPHVVPYGTDPVPGIDIIPVSDVYTGVGDAIALGRMMETFGGFNKPVKVRVTSETSFADLQEGPVILLGFNNRWNLQIARELRFSVEHKSDTRMVLADHTPPGQVWTAEVDPSGHTQMDYGLVSRVFEAGTGHIVVQAGGLASYGTRAAGEFLANSQSWNGFLEKVPRDWTSRNLQIVIRVKVIGNTPRPPEIVAIHCW